MRKHINILHKIVLNEIEVVQKARDLTYQSAVEINASSRHSPSQSGDREHAVNQAAIVHERLLNLKTLEYELKNVLNEPTPEKVVAPCYISLKASDGSFGGMYVVRMPVYIPDILMVSTDSRFGKAITGKKVEDEIEINGTNGKKKIVIIG